MLLGLVIDKNGLVPDADVKRAKEFGDIIRKTFSKPIRKISGKGYELSIRLNKETNISRIVLSEDIAFGERVLKYKLHPTRHFGIATIFQQPQLLPHLTAEENIILPLSSFLTEEKARRIAQKHLQEMEMEPFGNRYPKELSYGQQQRIAIARALAYPSPLLLMDEPFKGLDEALSHRIIERIREMQMKEERIILFTSHNPDEIRLLADEVIYL